MNFIQNWLSANKTKKTQKNKNNVIDDDLSNSSRVTIRYSKSNSDEDEIVVESSNRKIVSVNSEIEDISNNYFT